MGFLGFKSKKEVSEIENKARESGLLLGKQAVLNKQQNDLSNLAKGSQIKFAVPYFDVFDPRFENFAVPVAVHGTLAYAIDDIDKFNRINKTRNVNDGVFAEKLKGQLTKYIKGVVANAPADNGIQVLQLERKILEISELIQRMVAPKIGQLFGINVRSLDITQIVVDKDSRGYRELKSVTADLERETLLARQQASLSNFTLQTELNQDALKRQHEMQFSGQEELQRMQLENQKETMRIQREEMQRAARLQTESNFLTAHQANLNADVAKTGSVFSAQQPGSVPPMPGMAPPLPGAVPQVQYMVALNGQQAGPYNWGQLEQLVQQGHLTHQTYVWKQGMANWDFAGNVTELGPLFLTGIPGMPPPLQ
ncbi:MAG: DUF4339 domain-containing protein [Bacteroidales bacterium]|nr:DUF4339 domain-containing protein [Bacteroidales bacterium]